jgi:hypothetical protein
VLTFLKAPSYRSRIKDRKDKKGLLFYCNYNMNTIDNINTLLKLIRSKGACKGILCSECNAAFFGDKHPEYHEKEDVLFHKEQATSVENLERAESAKRRLLEILKSQHKV